MEQGHTQNYVDFFRMCLRVFHLECNVTHMNQTPPRHFGDQVAARIQSQGLTLRAVSDATGIPLTTLHRRLKTEDMSFTVGELSRIADLLGTTAGAIVTEFEAAA